MRLHTYHLYIFEHETCLPFTHTVMGIAIQTVLLKYNNMLWYQMVFVGNINLPDVTLRTTFNWCVSLKILDFKS